MSFQISGTTTVAKHNSTECDFVKKNRIDLNYINPNRSYIHPLYSENGDKILDERKILTPQRIESIKKKYGNIAYYYSDEEEQSVPPNLLMNAADNSRDLMADIFRTEKIDKKSYKKAEQIVETIISDLDFNDMKAINLLKTIKSYDEYLYQHQVNVGVLSAIFATRLGTFTREQVKFITLGAYLIDVGTVRLDRKMMKKEGKLDPPEMQQIKRHPQFGYEILKDITGIDPIVLQTVLLHHERYNSRGYYGLPYEELPLPPKIAAVCDIYDALTTNRPFRTAFEPSSTLKVLLNSINDKFDYKLISEFLNRLGPMLNNTEAFYKKGDICELNTKEMAMINDYGIRDFLKPKVMIFCRMNRTNKMMEVKFYPGPVEVDLQNDADRYMTRIITNPAQINVIKNSLSKKKLFNSYV